MQAAEEVGHTRAAMTVAHIDMKAEAEVEAAAAVAAEVEGPGVPPGPRASSTCMVSRQTHTKHRLTATAALKSFKPWKTGGLL